MKTYASNHLENLAVRLAKEIEEHTLPDPFAPETIVVQSRGMARWLSLEVASISGICMNFEFPFPRAFIGRTLRGFFPEMAPEEEFSAEVMAWKIYRLLPSLASRTEFAPVKNYLEEDDGLKAFQLSERIAGLFDQYLVYRPEMLVGWEQNREEKEWQATLWRTLVGENKPFHLASVADSLSERMAAAPARGILPERVSIFGISSMPPLYLRVFLELSRHCVVNLFSLHPSQEYYGHDLPPKLKAKVVARMGSRGSKISEDDFPSGNALLASLGKLNRDSIEVRLEFDERMGSVIDEQPDEFIEPKDESMLHTVQGDILRARNRGERDNPATEAAADRSIQIHACHSPMREIEVLYDQMLGLFEQEPSLKPRDIVVMTPDIEKYAPFIEAVFSYPENGRRYIPFSVADRRPRSLSPTIETFLSVLSLPGSRCTASEIFSLLDRSAIRRRFAFTDEDMVLIRQWIAETGIRWGIDAEHRTRFDLPALDANTWRAGLKRLFLGYAMAGGNRTMFEGIMPHDEVEGSGTEVLGRFASVLDALFDMVTALPKARPLADWPAALGDVIDQLFLGETQEEVADLRLIRTALDQLHWSAELAGSDQEVEFRVVRYHLGQLLDRGEQRGGFLTGGVTFCALQPMRSIPARVICLVGMGDQAFPRQVQAAGFDLMACEPRCGDRSVRDDDRYIFLEALISAREKFYCSYVGRSLVDNAEIPPSVLLSELLDYLDKAFLFPGGKTARDFVVTEHRLHAFSPQYFSGIDARLFSYSEANAAASRNLRGSHSDSTAPAFFAKSLSEPGDEARRVELSSLLEFFANPAKHFLRRRLGLRLEDEDDTLEDSEPFELDTLAQYHLKQELVAQGLERQTAGKSEFAARGVLPLGEIGVARFQALNGDAVEFKKAVESELHGEKSGEPFLVDLRIDPFSLSGKIESIYGGRIVQFRCASLKPKDRLRAWITHLARCAADPEKAAKIALIGTDETVRFLPVENASTLLVKLLGIYWDGLSRGLPFFPASALAYADAELYPAPRARSTPLDKARGEWNGSEWTGSGEKRDQYYAFCFADRDPLDETFTNLALAVYEPMLRHQEASA